MNDFQAHRDPDEPAIRSAALWLHVQAAARQEHDAEALTWERMQAALRRDAEARALAARGRWIRGAVIAGGALAAAVAITFALAPSNERDVAPSDVVATRAMQAASVGPVGSSVSPSAAAVDLPGGVAGSSQGGELVSDAATVVHHGSEAVLASGAGFVSRWSGAALSSVVAGFVATTDTVMTDVRRSSRGGAGALATSTTDEAEVLAVAAEAALAGGERSAAMGLLEKIVRKHPRSRQARAAMLDLARLRSAGGDRDGAACAYRRFLERYPSDEMRPDVSRRLGDLETPDLECRGIDVVD